MSSGSRRVCIVRVRGKTMGTIKIVTVLVIACSCLLLCTPVLAKYNFDGFPVTTRKDGMVNGGVFIGAEPWNGDTTLTGNFEVPEGDIEWARLYTGVWGSTENNEGWVEITFNGDEVGLLHLQGKLDTNPNVWCSGHGKHWIYFDVTDLVEPGSTNTATTTKIDDEYLFFNIDSNAELEGDLNNESIPERLKEEFYNKGFPLSQDASLEKGKENEWEITDGTKTYVIKREDEKLNIYIDATGCELDGRVYGIVLVVVYEGGEDPKDIQYWINEGSDDLNYKTGHDKGTTYFDGVVDTKEVLKANLTMVHLTAYDPACTECLQFNDNPLDTSMVDSNNFELNTWDVTQNIEAEDNYAWYSRGDDSYVSVTNVILIVEKRGKEDTPDVLPTAIKPYHYEWWGEKNLPKGEPWFNLTNYVNVTVENQGSDDAGRFVVNLYADDTLIGSKPVEELVAGERTDLKFEWRPEGKDPLSWIDTAEGAQLSYTDTSKTYKLRAVVDLPDEVREADEENNEFIQKQEVVWNGYMADEPLKNYVHGSVNGGIIYTTGNGQYRTLGSGAKSSAYDLTYDLAISGSTKLARLYIYYTWAKPDYKAPKIGVILTTPSGKTHPVAMEKSYNDIKGDFGAYPYAWGLYAYNITENANESGAYGVSISNVNNGDDPDFATEFAVAAPALLVVYENTTAPKREYWINEGADLLIGGRRDDGGFLSSEECKNVALFSGPLDLHKIEQATLGVVVPWGDSVEDDMLSFNDNELGKGAYCGYEAPRSKIADGILMNIGASNAQVGIAARDVTPYLKEAKNTVNQSDDGDNMMPSNAFLVITYPSSPSIEQTPMATAPATASTTGTPVPTQALTPPSSPPTGGEHKPEAAEAPIPGFELALALLMFMLMVVVRTIMGGRRKCG